MIKMTENETIIEEKRIRGFAGLLAKIMEPLNENPEFQETFKDTDRVYLINANNLKFAALVKIKDGVLSVESVPSRPKTNLKKSVLGWDGMVSMDSQLFLLMAANRLSFLQLGLKVLTRKIKIRGLTKLMGLLKAINILQG